MSDNNNPNDSSNDCNNSSTNYGNSKYSNSKRNNSGGSDDEPNDYIKAISYFGRVAFTTAACIIVCVLIGNFLDGLFGTSPWLLLVFSLIGLGAAFKSIFDLAKK